MVRASNSSTTPSTANRGDTVGHAQPGRSPPGHCGHAKIAHYVHLAERPCEPFEQLNPARVRLDRQNVCAYPPEEVAVQLAWRLGENSRCGQGWPAWRMNMECPGGSVFVQGVTGLAAGERAGSDGLVARLAGGVRSGVVDFEVAAGGGGNGLEVAGIRADDQVAAAQGSLDDAGVDDVGGG